jgi:hypothetical protein
MCLVLNAMIFSPEYTSMLEDAAFPVNLMEPHFSIRDFYVFMRIACPTRHA